jgi:tetratricopeptide (TPR) repeat protein
LRLSGTLLTSINTYTGIRQRGKGVYFRLFFVCIIITSIFIFGCSSIDKGFQTRSISREANDFFNQGKYEASLSKYEQIIEKNPAVADRVLFEMGIIYAYPKNEQKDYQKSLKCFQKIVRDYPDSEFRRDSQMMILQIHNVIIKNKIVATQQTQIETSRQEVKSKEIEIITLQEKIETLEQKIETLEDKIFALRTEPADKVLIEKKERRLTLLSKGEVIKTYKIALGGDPIGPKERQGDNKTPEGTYIIDSRNNNGLAWVGGSHAEVDWTKGCIAVTDEEMEEIYKLVPNGTIVEIRP